MIDQLAKGMVLTSAVRYQRISKKPGGMDAPKGVPRNNH